MKTSFLRILITLTFQIAIVKGYAQTPQMFNWYISPMEIKMPVNNPCTLTLISNAPIPGTPALQYFNVGNGFYDSNNSLLFYVANSNVYDYNSTLIGTINPPVAGSEIVIVPFGNNGTNTDCNKRFNIFTVSGGFNSTLCLVKSIVNLHNYSLSNEIIDCMPISSVEFGTLAVSSIVQTNNGDRYMYYMGASGAGWGEIRKATIHNNGTVSVAALPLYPLAQYSLTGIELFSQELDLSPDGKFLGWASYHGFNSNKSYPRYHFLELDPNGDYLNGSYHQMSIAVNDTAVNGFRGVEFYQNNGTTKLFVGAGNNGIYGIELNPGYPNSFVTGSEFINGFGYSQIETSYNGFIYATQNSVSNNNIQSFHPDLQIPTGNNFTLASPPKMDGWQGSNKFYTLPDQIDGQDYSSITPLPITQAQTLSTYFAASGQITWTNIGINPWNNLTGPYQVIERIEIQSGADITIDGMTINFSPQAKIIIHPGGKLTLNNTILTANDCGSTWQGVEVWGTSNQSQFLTSVQGKLDVLTGSKIEHARCGARN